MPNARKSWDHHVNKGWYVGPDFNAYRQYLVYLPATRAIISTNTLTWMANQVAVPLATQSDLIRAALQDLHEALNRGKLAQLAGTLPNTQVETLQELKDILTNSNSGTPTQPQPSGTETPSTPKTVQWDKGVLDNQGKTSKLPKYNAPENTAPVLRVPDPQRDLRVPPTRGSLVEDLDGTWDTTPPPPAETNRRSPRLQAHIAADVQAVCEATKLLDDPNEEILYTPLPKHFSYKAVNPDTGALSEYRELRRSTDGPHWDRAMCHEIGRSFQGYNEIQGNNTCKFIKFSDVPKDRKVTYCRIVVADRPRKAEPRRVRVTVGGDKVDYPGETSTKTAELVTCKILINSVLSTPGAKFMCMDLKDFYLGNPLPRKEYMRIAIVDLPQAIIDYYNLNEYDHNGYVYVEISKGMYGLPQSGRVASDVLIPRLTTAGYYPTKLTPGLFRHQNYPNIAFCLTVDDFGVKYVDKKEALHLKDTLEKHYEVTTDWEGTNYCGLDLDWDYDKRICDISIKGYVKKALQRFEHPPPSRPQHAPSKWTAPVYGAPQQFAEDEDTTQALRKEQTRLLREIIGTFLFYARAVDNTMLVALGTLAAAQSKGTEATMDAAVHLLNYAASHPDAIVRFRASDMILHVHSDASYLSEPKARSRVGGFYFLDGKDNPDPGAKPQLNGAIHVESRILRNVMSSATEAETAALFHNGQEGVWIRTILEELGHPQPGPTPIQTDNQVASGIANDTVKTKRTKSMDMRFYWIKDRVKQGQFRIHWKPGEENHADYFTKHHPPSHHQAMRPTYLHTKESANLAAETNCEGVLIWTRDSAVMSPYGTPD